MKNRTKKYIIGIDTSNYTTSVAACDIYGNLLFDRRIVLTVKMGERGLRQQEALFQHMRNVPSLIEELFNKMKKEVVWQIAGVAASDKPRPQEGSYMPVFLSGVNYGTVIAKTADAPIYLFSHQEGHIQAICSKNSRITAPEGLLSTCEFQVSGKSPDPFLAFHLSGGTTELLHVKSAAAGYQIDIIGGSRDLPIGQLIDRVGVALGMSFPCGREMDEIACGFKENQTLKSSKTIESGNCNFLGLKPIHIDDTWMNLSGIETQCQRMIANGCEKEPLIYELFFHIKKALDKVAQNAQRKTGIQDVIMAGGVSESKFMNLNDKYENHSRNDNPHGIKNCGADNAVGIAFLGLKQWHLDNREG